MAKKAVKKKSVKRSAKKTVKRPAKAVKKSVKRTAKKAVKKAVKRASGKPGRPEGAKSYTTETIGLKDATPFSRINEIEQVDGLRQIVIACSEPEYAIELKKLAAVVDKHPDKLLKWLKRQ